MIRVKSNSDEIVQQFRAFIKKKEHEIQKIAEIIPIRLGQLVKNEAIESIKNEGLVASGKLVKSISVTGLRASTMMREATVGSSSPYAKYVEEGVRAGGKMPPTDKIYEWMIQKGMEPSERGAYLISKKIAEKGIPARRPFEKGVEKAKSKINHEIQIILNETLTKD